MRIFRRKKTPEVIDLGEQYRRRERAENIRAQIPARQSVQNSGSDAGGLGFFGAIANTVSSPDSNSVQTYGNADDAEEKRRKLSRRLLDITSKIEELSNQVYHLQQRLEVIERKLDINRF